VVLAHIPLVAARWGGLGGGHVYVHYLGWAGLGWSPASAPDKWTVRACNNTTNCMCWQYASAFYLLCGAHNNGTPGIGDRILG
jgi:hypothetical protein